MSDEEPLLTGERKAGTSTGSDKILLLVQGQRNQDLLTDLLSDYETAVATPDADEELPEFDLCIIGEANYRAAVDTLGERKENAGKHFLPVLLLVGERGGSEISQRLHGVADDTLQIPTTEAIVRSRVESLLRTRRQSLQLALYRRAMDDATAGISITDADDDQPLIYINDAFLDMTGYDREEVLGRNCRFLQGEETEPAPVQRLHEAIDAGEAVSVELQNYRKDGTKFWNHLKIDPVYDDAGTLTHYIGFQSDITARRQAEERLQEETETLERLFETSPIGITVLDAEGQIVRANVAAEEVLRLERSDVVGRMFDEPNWEIVGENGGPVDNTDLPFSRVMATGERVQGYEHGIAEGGETRWLSINAAPLTDESGERIGVIATIEDVTERRAQERELERLVDLLDQTQSIADIGGWEIDTDSGDAEFTKGLSEVLGVWPQTEFDLDETLGFFDPVDEPKVREMFERLVATGEPQELECRFQTESGETRWAHVRGEPHQSEPSLYRGTVQDITDRREREQDLKETKDLLQSVFDASPVGILAVDKDGITRLWSGGCERIFGWSEEEALGEPLPNVQEGKQAEFAELRNEVIDGKEPIVGYETVRQRKDGSLVDVALTTAPMRNSDGEITGVVGLLEDLTEKKEGEHRLSVFDRVLRHNLRNKMHVVQAWAEKLAEDQTDETVVDAAGRILQASNELLALAEKVRKFDSVLDPGAPNTITTIDLTKRVEEIASEAELTYPAASISVDTPPVAEARAHEAFDMAVKELVDNAVKHGGEHPSVHISVTMDDESDAVFVRVADDGPGIPVLEQQSITAGKESPLQHTNGLGLWFVRWIATNSGGSMQIKDNEPTGSIVELRFSRQ